MAKYQERGSELGRKKFFEIFGDLPKADQFHLAEVLSKIMEVIRL